jgi:hypothetical protein
MPDRADEPQFISWPTCPERISVLGMALDCTLPELHDLDAQPEHEASNGTRWSVTLTMHDGQRITLRGRRAE